MRRWMTGLARGAACAGVLSLAGGLSFAPPAPPGFAEQEVKSLGLVENCAGSIALSRDGGRIAYRQAIRGEPERLVLDGEPGPPRDFGIDTSEMCFSPDGRRLAYAAERFYRRLVICDRRELTYGSRGFAFSPDSRHFAYVDARGVMMRDGTPDPPTEWPARPVYSPDSRRLAYAGGFNGLRCLVVDGRRGQLFESVGDPVFSPDGKIVACAVRDKGKWGVMTGASTYGGYDDVGKLVYSPDGLHLAHRARTGAKAFVVRDKEALATFEEVRDPVFSPAGGRLAYAARAGKEWLVVCDERKSKGYADVGTPVFSPDGKRVAWRAVQGGKPLIVCDGKESAPMGDVIWLGFSPDGAHLAAVVRENACAMVLDGLKGPAHLWVLVPERWYDPDTRKLRYVVLDMGASANVQKASLVEAQWSVWRTWEDAFKPAAKP